MAEGGGAEMTIAFESGNKIAQTSSKGNQEKWLEGGRWYKLDQFGYEGLAETLVSTLLEQSNIETDTPFQFVRYRMERMQAHGLERTGCSSPNFLRPGQAIITLDHLLSRQEGKSLVAQLGRLSSDKKRIEYLANATAELTGLVQFPAYLTLLFEIDALFLNDDRHLNNIAVLEQEGKYDYCPIFDHGAALLSNQRDYPMDVEPRGLIPLEVARPFHISFNRQRNTAISLFGSQLSIPRFGREDIQKALAPLLEYYPQRDRGLIFDRVSETILFRQKM